ncbi:MAG: F-box-like domain-containing protein [Candidatus Rhabdochlamydia sp.]
MKPLHVNALPKVLFFEIFSLVKPNDLFRSRLVCKQWNEYITAFFYSKLSELKNYTSEFELIDHAIQQIPASEDLRSLNVIEVLKSFNHTIADYNKTVAPFPVISCLQEVEELEQQLDEHYQFLGILWAALPISDKPSLETVTQIRAWFEDTQNQSVLDTIAVLDLKDCGLAQISKELFKLRNLESLNISANNLSILPPLIGQLKNLKKLKAEANYLKEIPKEIGQCSSLEILKVSGNQISKLPEELKLLTSLKKFCVSDNELDLSAEDLENLEFYNWEQIQRVDLSDNPLKESITADFVKTLWPSATEIDL